MHIAGLSTANSIALFVATTGVIGLLVAVWNAWRSVVNERRRTQPIVIAHEEDGRDFKETPDYFAFAGFITNESPGYAFNVRFGVELDGIRYAQKLRAEDPDSGNVQRVLRPDERLPTAGSWPILIPPRSPDGSDRNPDPGRVYWARYENAVKHTWETQSPWDRSARLNIKRVRFVRLRERREQRRRVKAGAYGVAWERAALAELRGRMTETERAEGEVPRGG